MHPEGHILTILSILSAWHGVKVIYQLEPYENSSL